jgi:hypothetical protein
MSAKNPNYVTIVNQTGATITKISLGHYAGISFVPPLGSKPILDVDNLANGATSPTGTAYVADGLADYWLMGLVMPGYPMPFVLVAFAPPVPYKKCDTPDHGLTTFILGAVSNDSIAVKIQTFDRNRQTDGDCNAVMWPVSSVSDIWAEIIELIGEWLGGALDRTGPASGSKASPATEVHDG